MLTLNNEWIKKITDEIPLPPGVGRTARARSRDIMVERLRRSLIGKKINPKAFDELKSELLFNLMTSQVEAYNPVGLESATSISHPITQMSLNTFHFAGDQTGTADTVGYIKGLLTGSKNNKNPTMYIPFTGLNGEEHFYNDHHEVIHRGTMTDMFDLKYRFEGTSIKDLVLNIDILNTDEAYDEEVDQLLDLSYDIFGETKYSGNEEFNFTYVVRLEIDTYRMFTHKILMIDIARVIEGDYSGNVKCVWRSQFAPNEEVSKTYIYIVIDESKPYNGEETTNLISPEQALLAFINIILTPSIKNFTVKGYSGIRYAEPFKVDIVSAVVDTVKESKYNYVYTNNFFTRWAFVSLADIRRVLIDFFELDVEELDDDDKRLLRLRVVRHEVDLSSEIDAILEGESELSEEDERILGEIDANKVLDDPNLSYGVKRMLKLRILSNSDNLYSELLKILGGDRQRVDSLKRSIRASLIEIKNVSNQLAEERTTELEIRESELIAEKELLVQERDEIEESLSLTNYYMLKTRGINYDDIIWRDDIDYFRLLNNDSHYIESQYGIEAAKLYLMLLFRQELTDFGQTVDPRHIELIYSNLTNLGEINGLSFHGVSNRYRVGPTHAATSERSLAVISNASVFGSRDPVLGITTSIIVGQPARIGMGGYQKELTVVSELDERPSYPVPNEEATLDDIISRLQRKTLADITRVEEREIEVSVTQNIIDLDRVVKAFPPVKEAPGVIRTAVSSGLRVGSKSLLNNLKGLNIGNGIEMERNRLESRGGVGGIAYVKISPIYRPPYVINALGFSSKPKRVKMIDLVALRKRLTTMMR